jgi:hypothetical protein
MFSQDFIDALPMLPLQFLGDAISAARLGNDVLAAFNAQTQAMEENRIALADLEQLSFRNSLAAELNKTRDRLNYNTAIRESRRQSGILETAFAKAGVNTTSGSALDQISAVYQNSLTQILRQA